MPWIDDVSSERFDEISFSRKLALWPNPNTVRINPFNRMVLGVGMPYPRATRYFIQIEPFDGESTKFWAWLDLDTFTENHLEGSTGLSPDGREIKLEIDQVWDPTKLFDEPGQSIAYKCTYSRTGFDPFFVEWKWDTSFQNNRVELAANFEPPFSFPWLITTDWTPVLNTDWTNSAPFQHWWLWSMSECYQLEEEAAGWADFNGVDSWIGLDHLIPSHGGDYDYEFEINMREEVGWSMFLGIQSTGRPYVGYLPPLWANGDFSFGSLFPPLEFNKWIKMKQTYRLARPVAEGVHIYADDVQVGQFNGTTQTFGGFNQVGRYFQGGGTFAFNGLMRNLLITSLAPGFEGVFLDMKLNGNADDDSPDNNNGTPHNITWGS